MTKVTIKVERDDDATREEYSVEQTHSFVGNDDEETPMFTVFSSRHGWDNVITDVSLQAALRGVAELVAETTDPADIIT